MSRLTRPSSESSNPSTKFLKWKSTEKAFQYYNKETKENVNLQLPLKVLFLEHYHTVKGWSDSAHSGIWSNEVYSIAKETLEVKSKAGTIANGIYKDNRTVIRDAGGVYHRSVYCMIETGEIINLQLKGAVIGGLNKETSVTKQDVKGYSDFYNDNNHLLDNQWIEINSFAEGKKGAVKFNIPVFEIGEVISKEDNELANTAVAELQAHMDNYFGVKEAVVETVEEEVTEDALDF